MKLSVPVRRERERERRKETRESESQRDHISVLLLSLLTTSFLLGTEYADCVLQFGNIENIHVMRKDLRRLHIAWRETKQTPPASPASGKRFVTASDGRERERRAREKERDIEIEIKRQRHEGTNRGEMAFRQTKTRKNNERERGDEQKKTSSPYIPFVLS
jgi:hypothetical protein